MKKLIQNAAFLIIAGGFFLAATVFAQKEGNPENFCRNGFFPDESQTYKLAKITGKTGARIYFYGDERDDCPQNKNCRLKRYVIPNDEVLVSRTFGNFACAWFQPKKGGETVGWLALENVEFKPAAAKIVAGDWLGKWRFYDNVIEIKLGKESGTLVVAGDATWKGFGDNVHVGEIEETVVAPLGNTFKIGEEDDNEYACRASMQMIGKYLIVSDNMKCGGANVTFSGVYQRNP
jgi:hypothetical protein